VVVDGGGERKDGIVTTCDVGDVSTTVARFGNSRAPIINYILLLIRITNTMKIYYKPSQIPFRVIPDAIPAEFEFPSEFHRNGNHNLAGTPAKIPFPWNSRNPPDSPGVRQEYMGDCKEL
jgi:hypothetical protein